MFELTGGGLAVIVVILWISLSLQLRRSNPYLRTINVVTFCWLTMTAITGIWEAAFLYNYDEVVADAKMFISEKQHVWTNSYDITYVNPWTFSPIMYTEYAAWGDRSYMSETDTFSRMIEFTHALYCSVFAALCLYRKASGDSYLYLIFMAVSMASQSMQCVVYMYGYFIETAEQDHTNFVTEAFPSGKYFEKRPFMYVNIFWTFMGLFVILEQSLSKGKEKHVKTA